MSQSNKPEVNMCSAKRLCSIPCFLQPSKSTPATVSSSLAKLEQSFVLWHSHCIELLDVEGEIELPCANIAWINSILCGERYTQLYQLEFVHIPLYLQIFISLSLAFSPIPLPSDYTGTLETPCPTGLVMMAN